MENTGKNYDESEPQERDHLSLTDENLQAVVGLIPEPDVELNNQFINDSVLSKLRLLDYTSRSKLMFLMVGLIREQHEKRQKFIEPLSGLVAIIDRIESEIKDEQFNDRLHDAVAALSRDEQKRLLTILEKNPASSPDSFSTGEGGSSLQIK